MTCFVTQPGGIRASHVVLAGFRDTVLRLSFVRVETIDHLDILRPQRDDRRKIIETRALPFIRSYLIYLQSIP